MRATISSLVLRLPRRSLSLAVRQSFDCHGVIPAQSRPILNSLLEDSRDHQHHHATVLPPAAADSYDHAGGSTAAVATDSEVGPYESASPTVADGTEIKGRRSRRPPAATLRSLLRRHSHHSSTDSNGDEKVSQLPLAYEQGSRQSARGRVPTNP